MVTGRQSAIPIQVRIKLMFFDNWRKNLSWSGTNVRLIDGIARAVEMILDKPNQITKIRAIERPFSSRETDNLKLEICLLDGTKTLFNVYLSTATRRLHAGRFNHNDETVNVVWFYDMEGINRELLVVSIIRNRTITLGTSCLHHATVQGEKVTPKDALVALFRKGFATI